MARDPYLTIVSTAKRKMRALLGLCLLLWEAVESNQDCLDTCPYSETCAETGECYLEGEMRKNGIL